MSKRQRKAVDDEEENGDCAEHDDEESAPSTLRKDHIDLVGLNLCGCSPGSDCSVLVFDSCKDALKVLHPISASCFVVHPPCSMPALLISPASVPLTALGGAARPHILLLNRSKNIMLPLTSRLRGNVASATSSSSFALAL